MQEIPLTQNQVAIIDDEDYERVSKYKWCAQKIVQKWRTFYYAKRAFKQDGKHTTIHLHRFLMNPPPGMQVDHKNGNTLDNRRSNLRLATCAQNQRNRRKKGGGLWQYKGVNYVAERRKHLAVISKNGVRYRLGGFNTAEEAARAYDAKAKELFGEFAYLNFPEQEDIHLSNHLAA